ncbi:MAG: hypothetical protein JNM56_40660 [Planctomycetia bacterium]|nr:hypothetical protein [Planctomycetia bacterium]
MPLPVRDGSCSWVLPGSPQQAQFGLVVASLAHGAGPYRVRIVTEATAGPGSLTPVVSPPDDLWQQQIRLTRERLQRARQRQAFITYPAAEPPRERAFHLFMGEMDFHNAESYTEIRARLQAVGKHCQVYVDGETPDQEPLRAAVSDAVRTFDEEVHPQARQRFGGVLDVDRDGRFTLLFTPKLSRLCNGKVTLGGCVRGSDFHRDLAAPFGNRCDLMFLNADLPAGPHLRTLIAHEYTHAIIYSEHLFGDYLPSEPRRDEQCWLNEGLAHVNEDLHAYSGSNLDYRVSTFLNAPERYSLVVPDYYRAGLFRSHGHRGSSFLFLRWCVQRHGEALLERLSRSNLAGIANLEAATGERFANLFRAWTTDLARGQLPSPRPSERLLCGPRTTEFVVGSEQEVALTGTSAKYLRLHVPPNQAVKLSISTEGAAELQATLVPLPADLPRLSLQVRPEPTGYRLLLTCPDAALTLEAVAWEKVTPGERRADDTNYRPDAAATTVHTWFGEPRLRAGETRVSELIAWPTDSEPRVFKVSATDAAGRRVAAWVDLARP